MKKCFAKLVITFFLSTTMSVLFAQNLQTVKTYYDPWTKVHLKEVYVIDANTTAMNGSYKMYDENGIIYKEGNYKNSLKNGVFKYYFCAPGVLSRITTYKMDINDGLDEEYFCITDENGKNISKKQVSTIYSNGKFVKETEYYKNGSVKHSTQANGLCTQYYENGKKKEECNAINDVYIGLFTSWHENGNIKIQGNYVKGIGKKYNTIKEVGKWVEYFENGKLKSEIVRDSSENIISSQENEYYESANIKSSLYSTKDSTINITYYDNNLSKKSSIRVLLKATGKGNEIGYYENGNKKSETTIINGKKNGEFIEWFENGQIKTKGTYNDNKEIGVWITYFESGNKESQLKFETSSRPPYESYKNGEAITYYSNGKIKEQGEYKINKKSGTWYYYKEDGILDYAEEYENGSVKSKKTKAELDNENALKEYNSSSKICFSKFQEVNKAYEVSESKPGKKKNLYNAFLILYQDRNSKILNSKDNFLKVELTNELIKLLDKMSTLSATDTKELEKSLKKEVNPDNIKTILGL